MTNRTPAHHRLTFKDVLKDYKDGLLTAKGAIFYIVGARRKLGEVVRLSPRKISVQLEISRSSFYRALNELKSQKRLDCEIVLEGDYLLRIPTDQEGIPLHFFLEGLSQKSDNLSQISDNLSQKSDKLSQILDKLSQILDNLSQILDKKDSELALQASSELLQSIQSIQSFLSLSLQENEREKKDLKTDPEFRSWLATKVELLPQKPVFKELWIDKQSQLESNQKEFLEYRNSLQRTIIPENLSEEEILDPSEYWQKVYERRSSSS